LTCEPVADRCRSYSKLCLRLFKSNRDAGLILFAGMLLDSIY